MLINGLVSQLHGRMEIQDQEKGACFVVEFPLEG
jgi:sensor histidine kinase regulating citrate/malate metabolism